MMLFFLPCLSPSSFVKLAPCGPSLCRLSREPCRTLYAESAVLISESGPTASPIRHLYMSHSFQAAVQRMCSLMPSRFFFCFIEADQPVASLIAPGQPKVAQGGWIVPGVGLLQDTNFRIEVATNHTLQTSTGSISEDRL